MPENVVVSISFSPKHPKRLSDLKLDLKKFRKVVGGDVLGVEYYVIDPVDGVAEGWVRDGDEFREVDEMNGFVSPRLGIRFDTSGEQLVITHPDGRPFQTFQQLVDRAMEAERQAERQKQENERLRAILRTAGIDPDKPPA